MAMRPRSGKKPKRLGYTVKRLLGYMGRHKLLLFAVALLVTLSAGANLAGTYMIRPVVNSLTRGDWGGFVSGVVLHLRPGRALLAGLYPVHGRRGAARAL